MEKFFEEQFKMLSRGIVATPNTREDLEQFAKANGGSMDIILMQMAINFGYKIALENVQEQLEKEVAQMGEQCIKGKWKLRAPTKLPKSSYPMVGMVYEGVDKFFGRRTIGVLVEMFDQNDEAVLKTIGNKLVSVDKTSLKIVVGKE